MADKPAKNPKAAPEPTAKKATKKTGQKSEKGTAKKASKKTKTNKVGAKKTSKKTSIDYLVRPADIEDVSTMVAIGNALGFFDADNSEEAVELLTQYFSGRLAGHAWLAAELDATVIGVAYFAPEPKTVGTWNLTFLGVNETCRNKGCGQALLAKVEQTLQMTKGRIIVETAGTETLATVRGFFTAHGYVEQAHLTDFYETGKDKIIQLKTL